MVDLSLDAQNRGMDIFELLGECQLNQVSLGRRLRVAGRTVQPSTPEMKGGWSNTKLAGLKAGAEASSVNL